MTGLGTAALFLLGVYLSMRLIAAGYRALDLWYAIGREYGRVLRGIVCWGGATVAVALLSSGPYRRAFSWGLAAFALFYLGLYPLRNLWVRRLLAARQSAAGGDAAASTKRRTLSAPSPSRP